MIGQASGATIRHKDEHVRNETDTEPGIDRERIIATLRKHQVVLRRSRVRRAVLFGSLARAEGKGLSNIDILIKLDRQTTLGLFEYRGITPVPTRTCSRFASMSPTAEVLKPLARPSIECDAIYAF